MSEQDKTAGMGMLTVPEMADRLQWSVDKVRDLVNVDGMPCCALNPRMWRFHWPTVLTWLQKRP